ncbi:MAG: hypothetical protein NC253_15640 [Ruminococcus sp.]|nr:hypothetical protein [Ruminococcus sp.]MCM1380587.1 hypothetical protein [Muribaculaceae bacterium]MCM1479770.1 hypothetical protein [Muribaculaceae bacterium]
MKDYEPFLSLNQCVSLNQKKKEIIDKLKELKSAAYYPAKQDISDMPKSGGEGINRIDAYLIKLEKLECEIKAVNLQISDCWRVIRREIKGIASKEETDMLRMRFCLGWQWKKCAAEMQKKYGVQWNMNKIFGTYRKLLAKCTK